MIYFLQRANGDVKIGITTSFNSRLQALEIEHGKLKPLGFMQGYRDEERALHEKFAMHGAGREWFKPVPVLISFIQANTTKELPSDNEELVSVRLDGVGRNIVRLIRRKYREETLASAFMRFMEDNHAQLVSEAVEATAVERAYNGKIR